jgi:signal transduction histidine kinase
VRARLTFIYVLLLVLVLVALEVPLAVALAGRDTQRLAADRMADATRFATLAEPALRAGEVAGVQGELGRYDELYGVRASLLDREGRVVAGAAVDSGPGVRRQLRRALAGEQADDDGTVWPWRGRPYVVAAPVGSGGEVLGAVLVVSGTAAARSRTGLTWLLLAGVGLASVAVSVAAAGYLARWSLRPVAELDAVVHHIAAGDYAARVWAHGGPPELSRLTEAFNEMADLVGDALERQRAFVAQASHQLRNPLTALRLRVEDLGEDLTSDWAREEHRLALAETERLGHVLQSLLALASAERGRYVTESVDAAAVAADRVAAWQPLAVHRGVALGAETPPGRAPVRAVSTALDQALDALIDNALKFAGAGARVEVRVVPSDGGVAVHVVDDGPGLDAEQLARATERFWRAPAAQNVDGSGLGLPIVTVLVQASGGRLELRAAEPRGLDARVWLPAGE